MCVGVRSRGQMATVTGESCESEEQVGYRPQLNHPSTLHIGAGAQDWGGGGVRVGGGARK